MEGILLPLWGTYSWRGLYMGGGGGGLFSELYGIADGMGNSVEPETESTFMPCGTGMTV